MGLCPTGHHCSDARKNSIDSIAVMLHNPGPVCCSVVWSTEHRVKWRSLGFECISLTPNHYAYILDRNGRRAGQSISDETLRNEARRPGRATQTTPSSDENRTESSRMSGITNFLDGSSSSSAVYPISSHNRSSTVAPTYAGAEAATRGFPYFLPQHMPLPSGGTPPPPPSPIPTSLSLLWLNDEAVHSVSFQDCSWTFKPHEAASWGWLHFLPQHMPAPSFFKLSANA